MSSFQVKILEADRPFYVGECESLTVPTIDGQHGILAGHSNMIVAIVPGTAFGDSGEGHIRCSYATSIENLNEALSRIRQFLAEL